MARRAQSQGRLHLAGEQRRSALGHVGRPRVPEVALPPAQQLDGRADHQLGPWDPVEAEGQKVVVRHVAPETDVPKGEGLERSVRPEGQCGHLGVVQSQAQPRGDPRQLEAQGGRVLGGGAAAGHLVDHERQVRDQRPPGAPPGRDLGEVVAGVGGVGEVLAEPADQPDRDRVGQPEVEAPVLAAVDHGLRHRQREVLTRTPVDPVRRQPALHAARELVQRRHEAGDAQAVGPDPVADLVVAVGIRGDEQRPGPG